MILFKSRLYREEILRFLLIVTLFVWACVATAWALSSKSEVILISLNGKEARLVTGSDDKSLHDEPLEFIQSFMESYLNYNSETFTTQIGKASDLMAQKLWEEERQKLYEIGEKLKHNPLAQVSDIQSIDLLAENRFEVLSEIRITHRLQETRTVVKLLIRIQKRKRTRENPWAYEVVEIRNDAI